METSAAGHDSSLPCPSCTSPTLAANSPESSVSKWLVRSHPSCTSKRYSSMAMRYRPRSAARRPAARSGVSMSAAAAVMLEEQDEGRSELLRVLIQLAGDGGAGRPADVGDDGGRWLNRPRVSRQEQGDEFPGAVLCHHEL